MDGARFDRLARTLSSRRTALGGLLGGGVVVLLGMAEPESVGAHNVRARCRRIKHAPRRRACLRRARVHNRAHRPPTCLPQATAVTCGGRCGVWRNNCNREVSCLACPPGRTCLINGGCGTACTADANCPPGCHCTVNSNAEGAGTVNAPI